MASPTTSKTTPVTNPTAPATPTNASHHSQVNAAIIAGVLVGFVILTAVLAAIIVPIARNRRKRRSTVDGDQQEKNEKDPVVRHSHHIGLRPSTSDVAAISPLLPTVQRGSRSSRGSSSARISSLSRPDAARISDGVRQSPAASISRSSRPQHGEFVPHPLPTPAPAQMAQRQSPLSLNIVTATSHTATTSDTTTTSNTAVATDPTSTPSHAIAGSSSVQVRDDDQPPHETSAPAVATVLEDTSPQSAYPETPAGQQADAHPEVVDPDAPVSPDTSGKGKGVQRSQTQVISDILKARIMKAGLTRAFSKLSRSSSESSEEGGSTSHAQATRPLNPRKKSRAALPIIPLEPLMEIPSDSGSASSQKGNDIDMWWSNVSARNAATSPLAEHQDLDFPYPPTFLPGRPANPSPPPSQPDRIRWLHRSAPSPPQLQPLPHHLRSPPPPPTGQEEPLTSAFRQSVRSESSSASSRSNLRDLRHYPSITATSSAYVTAQSGGSQGDWEQFRADLRATRAAARSSAAGVGPRTAVGDREVSARQESGTATPAGSTQPPSRHQEEDAGSPAPARLRDPDAMQPQVVRSPKYVTSSRALVENATK